MKKKLPKIHNKKIVAKTRLFQIESVDLEFSNGVTRVFERFLGVKNSVMIIPIVDSRLLLVKEYALGTERYEITFPKGIIDLNESLFEAANRELKEEIGFGANDLYLMKEITNSPGYASGKMHMILAKQLYREKLVGDEPEEIELVECNISNIDQFIMRDDFTDARSIAAMLLVARMFTGVEYKLEKLT
ncbi:MAG: ADP compounds hydrolase NudE [Legionellales bacterium]|nr:ADP compounds hydrolase NudE [Legionellales bacterium]